ncbi:MAG: hypothetical protein V9G18_14115 [Albidovulum sp.]
MQIAHDRYQVGSPEVGRAPAAVAPHDDEHAVSGGISHEPVSERVGRRVGDRHGDSSGSRHENTK